MTRAELEHIIRASAAAAEDTHVVILGSQSILGRYPDAPAELVVSMEADVYPKHHPDRAILIEGAIGELSTFHQTFGYYAHSVGPETAVLPEGWEPRVVIIRNANTRESTGECLEPHDLAVSKMAARREKDLVFVRQMIAFGMVSVPVLEERIEAVTAGGEPVRERLRETLRLVSQPPDWFRRELC